MLCLPLLPLNKSVYLTPIWSLKEGREGRLLIIEIKPLHHTHTYTCCFKGVLNYCLINQVDLRMLFNVLIYLDMYHQEQTKNFVNL